MFCCFFVFLTTPWLESAYLPHVGRRGAGEGEEEGDDDDDDADAERTV